MTIILLFFSMNLHAVVDLEELSLHEMTKIYSKNNSDFFVGCENFEEYMHSEPTMTVFTHGYDSNASHWSNDATKGNILADNASSLIHKIAIKNNYCVDIYLAQCLSQENFVLTKYSWDLKEKKMFQE